MGLRFWSSRVKSGASSPTLMVGSGGPSFFSSWARRLSPGRANANAIISRAKNIANLLRMNPSPPRSYDPCEPTGSGSRGQWPPLGAFGADRQESLSHRDGRAANIGPARNSLYWMHDCCTRGDALRCGCHLGHSGADDSGWGNVHAAAGDDARGGSRLVV